MLVAIFCVMGPFTKPDDVAVQTDTGLFSQRGCKRGRKGSDFSALKKVALMLWRFNYKTTVAVESMDCTTSDSNC